MGGHGFNIHNNKFLHRDAGTGYPSGTGVIVFENRVHFGGLANTGATVSKNFLSGGGYTTYNGGWSGDCPTNVFFNDNTFDTSTGAEQFGYMYYSCGSTFTQMGGSFQRNACSTNGATILESDGNLATACSHGTTTSPTKLPLPSKPLIVN